MKPNTVSETPGHPGILVTILLGSAATVLWAIPGTVNAAPEGCVSPIFSENFDGVTAPTLPAGWLAANIPVGTAPLWVTSPATPDTPPNDIFVNDPATVTDKRLDTPGIAIPSAPVLLTFRNNYNLENTFDGGVLEVSAPNIAQGTFVDITNPVVGGSFVTGGYNSTISTLFQSPIAGRSAWSGNSGGYITTMANLGPNVAGQTIRLRFRMASDNSVSATGWRVDTFVATADFCATPSPTPPCVPATEAFDDITSLVPAGWFMQNNSQPGPGTTGWFQGNSAVFTAHSGTTASYIGANYNSGTGTSTLSNWLLTPLLSLQSGAQLTFFTRTTDTPQFPDRLQVRLSTNGASTNVGATATSVGDFTTLLLDINPNYATTGYPTVWTLFTVTVAGPTAPITGRLAFRYFVENGGPLGANSNYIGIDTLRITGGCVSGTTPTPTPTATAAPTATATATPTAPPGPVITSPLGASGLLGKQCIYQFEATGADFLDVANLPPGLTFNSFLSAITGVPTAEGAFKVQLSAANAAGGTTNATLNLFVQPTPAAGPVITSSTSATGRVGQPFAFRVITIGGSPAARLTTDNLPSGLSADAVTGLISGIPTTAGSSSVFLTVTDGSLSTNAQMQLTFISDPARPVIVSPDTASLPAGQPFSYTIRAPSSAVEPTIFTLIGDLPAGLGFDSETGTIAGTYIPPPPRPATGSDRPDVVDLAGGALLGSVQLFGTNSHGTGTFQLLFLATPSGVINISTRMLLGTDENVLIGGFIVTGNAPKVVVIRALGPSLAAAGISGALQDPTLELHDGAHPKIVVSNDNWRDSQQQVIQDTGIPPTNDLESAIVAGLDPGNYTAIVRGKANTTGVGVVEVYDLGTASVDASSNARLAQISTRGTVLTGDNVMIGGFIINGAATRVIVRAIGPELSEIVPNALQDTILDLRDGSGSLVASNDDWRSTQEQEIINTGVPPTDNRESAIVANLTPGPYTGIVRGKNDTTGVALVEVYGLQ